MAFAYTSFRIRTPARGHGPIFAVGRHVYIACARSRSAGVKLTDDAGADGATGLADGTEVEILAWRPQTSETRYRVRSTRAGLEGWLPAGNLRIAKSAAPPAKAPVPTSARRGEAVVAKAIAAQRGVA